MGDRTGVLLSEGQVLCRTGDEGFVQEWIARNRQNLVDPASNHDIPTEKEPEWAYASFTETSRKTFAGHHLNSWSDMIAFPASVVRYC